jgi:hypothetical protein
MFTAARHWNLSSARRIHSRTLFLRQVYPSQCIENFSTKNSINNLNNILIQLNILWWNTFSEEPQRRNKKKTNLGNNMQDVLQFKSEYTTTVKFQFKSVLFNLLNPSGLFMYHQV